MASGEATRNFDDRLVKKDDSEKAVLSYKLKGFKPSDASHSCFAKVSSNNELIVEATMKGQKYQDVIEDFGLTDSQVSAKGSKDTIEVHIKKPDKNYSIQSKLS